MDDKELGRMLRLEKVEENTFPEEKTKEVLQKEKHDQAQIPSEETNPSGSICTDAGRNTGFPDRYGSDRHERSIYIYIAEIFHGSLSSRFQRLS